MPLATRIAAILGFLGVALGAFGAHKLKNMGVTPEMLVIWQTGVLYQLIHSVAALWASERRPVVVWIWATGIVIFSGSLYLLVLTGFTKLGMITPIGGLLFLVGWAMIVWKPQKG